MKEWMKWLLIPVLLAVLVVGVIVANKLAESNEKVETTEPPTEAIIFTEDDEVLRQTTYEEYLAMTEEEQIAFKKAFSGLKAYTKWYNEAKRIYDSQGVDVMGTDQTINIGDLINSGE